MKRNSIILFLLLTALAVKSQELITGKIEYRNGQIAPLPLVSLFNRGGEGVLTDENGVYSIQAQIGDILLIETSDGIRKEIVISQNPFNIVINDLDKRIERGFDTQTSSEKATLSYSSISAATLEKFSVMNPENALYGNLAGLAVLSNGGAQYANNPTILLRGLGSMNNSQPLILVDGIERPLNRISIPEIQEVTVLKDAAAVALYGIRGANGVIAVTTKRGEYGKMKIDVDYQHGLSKAFRLPKMVDAPTYAMALNEALTNDRLPQRYTNDQIGMFKNGTNPDLYPNVDWQKEALREWGASNELNISFSGGNNKVQYFANINYANDFGLLKDIPSAEGYNTQLDYYKLNLRTNLDYKLTQSTLLRLNLMGAIDDHSQPNVSANEIFKRTSLIPATAFPVRTQNNNWGGSLIHSNQNPVAAIAASGFARRDSRMLFADLKIEQDLSMILKGLSAEVGIGYDNLSDETDTQAKTFEYETGGNLYGSKSELSFTTILESFHINNSLFGKLNYKKNIEDHSLNALMLYSYETVQKKLRNNKVARQNFVFATNYSYKQRYIADLAFSYSGSSYLPKREKFNFYPTISGAWVASSESFMKNIASINNLKLRASYGLSGNDNLGYELDKHLYAYGANYWFTASNGLNSGIKEGALAVSNLKAELAKKTNVGIDIIAFKNLNLAIDAFIEKRSNILVSNSGYTSSILGIDINQASEGIVKNKGMEISLTYQNNIKDFKYSVSGQFSYVKNTIENMKEQYHPYDYMERTGHSIGSYFGLKTDGFFKDQNDINNSYYQTFGPVLPGDIKYVNQNNDNVINEYDVVKLGYSTLYPEIYYGFSVAFEYKGLGLDAQFQGIDNFQVVRNAESLYWPMKNNNNISQWYYNGGRWTENNKENAKLPRLTTLENNNNFRGNSLWLEDGSYLKLRTLELYYNLPEKVSERLFTKSIKLFVRGMNLFSLDQIKDKDPEMMTTAYPTLKSFHMGASIKF